MKPEPTSGIRIMRGYGAKHPFWIAAWKVGLAARRTWFVNEPRPEMVQVPSTGEIRNFAYTEEWTGRMVQPWKCFNPIERKKL
jgi:hypothetical protein